MRRMQCIKVGRLTALGAMFGLIVVPWRACAAPPAVDDGQPSAKSEDEAKPARGDDSNEGSGRRRGPGARGGTQDTVEQLKKLHDAVHDDLHLSSEQARTIDQLFEEHVKTLRERGDRPGGADFKPQDREEIKQLGDQLQQARDAGDDEAVKSLSAQLREKMRGQINSRMGATAPFLEKVAAELNETQAAKFRELVQRFRLDNPPRRSGGAAALLRAVMNPNVDLTREQHEKIRDIMQRGYRGADRDRGDEKDMAEAAAKTKAEIMKELSPEQRAIVDENLAKAEKEGPPLRRMEGQGPSKRPSPPEPPDSDDDDDKDSDD